MQHLRQHRSPRSAARATYDIYSLQATDLTRTFSSSSDERLNHQLVACARCGLQYVSPRLRADAVLEGYAARIRRTVRLAGSRDAKSRSARCLDADRAHLESRARTSARHRNRRRILSVTSRRSAAGRPRAANRIAGSAIGRWRTTACRFVPARSSSRTTLPSSFDVVTLWDVLEHTPDPKTEVRETHRLLKEDGLLVINYPDIGSWIARLMGRSWVFLLDVHLYYFTREPRFAKLLEDAGFEIVRIRPHFQRLALGYVLHRAMPYCGAPARVCRSLVFEAVGIAEWQVPYWMGQTLVIARKRATIN